MSFTFSGSIEMATTPAKHDDVQVAAPFAPRAAVDLTRRGAHLVDGGIDVVVFASRADRVDMCLLDDDGEGGWIERRFRLRGPVSGVWHGHLPGVRAGQHYGFRVHGAWAPERGLRHNPAKLLLDPYARAVHDRATLAPEIYAHVVDDNFEPTDGTASPDPRDSAAFVPHGVIVDDAFDAAAPAPRTPLAETVIYEAHVRGLTMNLPGVPKELRGTYAGVAHPATVAYLKDLGITAVELLPIHASMDEPFLAGKGLANYWGYNTIGFFAPEPSYATASAREAGPQAVLDEVKGMVALLHEAGLEVLLDVVYNHTAEAGTSGPCVSLRGLDSHGYYLHDEYDAGRIEDVTGTGNSLDFRKTDVVRLALDSLRYWVSEVGIDGFRFDLAVTLGRNGDTFSKHHPFYVALATDPVLRSTKLIVEPWDLGVDGWKTGQFDIPISEWNDRFRDTVRGLFVDSSRRANKRGYLPTDLRDIATRMAGSADMYAHGELPAGRSPLASINYVTAHDGFTLADLVSYNRKHNEANLEHNRDGTDNNLSWNHGVEGPTNDAKINTARRTSMRNLLAVLLTSSGVPMLLGGDEFGRSQGGNNNAYCQDNDISWLDWSWEPWQADMHAATRSLLRLRRENPALRPAHFALGMAVNGDRIADVRWCSQDGTEVTPHQWENASEPVLQMFRSGVATGGRDALVVINRSLEDVDVVLAKGREHSWKLVWDSALDRGEVLDGPEVRGGSRRAIGALSVRIYLAALPDGMVPPEPPAGTPTASSGSAD